MDISQTFNILEVDKIRTDKLDYSYSNNIININKNNSINIVLNSSHSNNYLITNDSDMDIIIKLTSPEIGTKYRILITNIQKSLKISCTNQNDKFKGTIKINNNSGNINEENLNNNLKKNITQTTTEDDIIYIPHSKIGLYNGGYIDLLYTGDNNCNKQFNIVEGYWLVNSELIGNISLPKTINSISTYLLTIYMYNDSINNKHEIINVTTKNNTTGEIYYNNIENNNIVIFLNISYDIKIITVNDNITVYDSVNGINKYKFKIGNNGNFSEYNSSSLNFINDFNLDINYNIKEIYNKNIEDYNKLNILEYKIENGDIVNKGIFNIITIKSYNNSDNINNNLSNLLFGYYNIFTKKDNILKLEET